MKISYGITVHKEHEELNQLLDLLVNETDTDDEIIIGYKSHSADE